MAISGNWRNSQQRESGALKWGTGINPVHAVNDSSGRDIAPGGTTTLIDPVLVGEPWQDYEFFDYGADDNSNIEDHPGVGTSTGVIRNNAGNFPEWGPRRAGIPGGTAVRSEDHGAAMGIEANQTPDEDVAQGWLNKDTGSVELAEGPAVSQTFRQTSEQQLFATRAGSQRGSGSDSEYSQPISSRIPGQKILHFSRGQREYDMQPREQLPRVRGWWSRTAGTGRVHWMEANALNPVQPRTREIPPEPSTGPPVLAYDIDYGYQSEDLIPYA